MQQARESTRVTPVRMRLCSASGHRTGGTAPEPRYGRSRYQCWNPRCSGDAEKLRPPGYYGTYLLRRLARWQL